MEGEILEILKQLGITGFGALGYLLFIMAWRHILTIHEARIEDYQRWLDLLKSARITIVQDKADYPTDRGADALNGS